MEVDELKQVRLEKLNNLIAKKIDPYGQRFERSSSIAAILDDFKEENGSNNGSRIIGKISDFERVARTQFINKVFITSHHDSQKFLGLLESAKKM